MPGLTPRLRVFVVGGAFAGCFGDGSLAYRRAIEALAGQGLRARPVEVSGRSSAEFNAALIAADLAGEVFTEDDLVVLVGYSKGVIDILHFLVEFPALAARVDAVVGISGPVLGSRVASRADWIYDLLFKESFATRCDPGDGEVIDSLLPDVRLQWMKAHALPEHVRYFTLGAFTTREHIARGLVSSWEILAKDDLRNDGQVTIDSALIPGSVLLGYANSDHWALAIDIEEELEWLSHRPDPQPFPRTALFEALLRTVAEDLQARPADGLPDRAAVE